MTEASAAFTIRPATADDEPALIEIQQSSAAHHARIDPIRWRATTIEEEAASRGYWHASRPRSEALLAVAGDKVVGMIELWLHHPRGPVGARVRRVNVDFGIAVASGWRGRGVGTALLRAAEDWGREHGADRMSMDLAAANDGALRLYEREGYVVHSLAMDKPIEGAKPVAPVDADVIRNANGEPVPTLRGELVVLRPLRRDDRDDLLAVLSDPSVVAIWDTRGAEHSVNEIYAGDKDWTPWVIEVDGEFAGSIQAAEEDHDYRHAGIDIFMSSGFQNRGLGTDAVRTLARYLLEVRGHHRLTIDPAADNARAIRSYEKVGFKPVGVMRGYERGGDGTYHDGLLMDMLAGEPMTDRVIAITGATGRLGRVISARFAASGARLALLARSDEEVAALAAELPGGIERHAGFAADLGSSASAADAAAAVRARLGPVSVLLHLVGGYAGGTPFVDGNDEEWTHLIDLNLWSTVHAIRAFLPDIVAAKDGRIVTMSTYVAGTPTPKHAAYAATKAAVEALTISVARDLAGTTATSNVIVIRAIGDEKPADTRAEEIAAAMAWLCSPEAGAINGQRVQLFGRAGAAAG